MPIMSEPEAPKIEFPCPDYPVKVMGEASDEYYDFAVAVMEKYAPGLDRARLTKRISGKGNFQSITFFITATGLPQLEGLHNELRSNPKTKIVL